MKAGRFRAGRLFRIGDFSGRGLYGEAFQGEAKDAAPGISCSKKGGGRGTFKGLFTGGSSGKRLMENIYISVH
ncbi:hypothetical protein [Succinimonas amylolytica]|uniref:hypothetical protein n=1 Tax=Succinimonas amylolytica TaxID=83769 RepID=UPI00036D6444|nr:hypothetical protein [Succinimonas amylolytica]